MPVCWGGFSRRGQLRRVGLVFLGVLAVWQVFSGQLTDSLGASPEEKGVDLHPKPAVPHSRRIYQQEPFQDTVPRSTGTKGRANLGPDRGKENILAPPPGGGPPGAGARGTLANPPAAGPGGYAPAGRAAVQLVVEEDGGGGGEGGGGVQGEPSSCPGLVRPPPVKDNHQWLRVGLENDTFVYSAFYETRLEQPKVRIVAITDTKKDHPRFCQVWYNSKPGPDILKAVSDIVPETHGRRYAPFFYLCGLPTTDVPYAVSLVIHKCDHPGHVLPVLNSDLLSAPQDKRTDFTVCVTPLNFHYNKVNQLVEFLEVNHMFGADRFVFYNHTTGPDVERYLKTFASEGLVDVLPWQLPMQTDVWPHIPGLNVEIHYFAQLAALNDCLYRYMYSSTYLVFIDLDEVIVPKESDNWGSMLQRLSARISMEQQETPVAYIFKNVFFRSDWPADDSLIHNQTVARLNLQTLLVTKREAQIWMWKARSKYIVDPMGIDMVGIHNIWQFMPNVHEVMVDEDQGLLHHYRNWQSPETGGPRVLDRTMHKYMDRIIESTKARHKLVEKMNMHL